MTRYEYQQIDIPRVEKISIEARNINSPDNNILEIENKNQLSEVEIIIVNNFKIGNLEKKEAELLLSYL